MNRVAICCEDIPLPRWSPALKRYTRKVLACLGKDKWDLDILLCGDAAMSRLNAQYRGKDSATDVLSFASSGKDTFPTYNQRIPGDIAISLETLRENASRFKISGDEELRRLLIHGILHLNGMNHSSNGKTEPMLILQEKILAELAGESIMGRNA